MKRIAFGFVLGLAGLFAFAGGAAACVFDCVQVSPQCRRCLDTGGTTNVTCRNSGPCNCFFTQNTCGLAAQTGESQIQQAALDLGIAPEQAVCQSETAAFAAQ